MPARSAAIGRAPELGEAGSGNAMQRAAKLVVEEMLKAEHAVAGVVEPRDILNLAFKRMGALGRENAGDSALLESRGEIGFRPYKNELSA